MLLAESGWYRLEANQNLFYPTFSNPHTTIRACVTSGNETDNLNEMEPLREGFTFRE